MVRGDVVDAVPLEELGQAATPAPSASPATLAPGVPHPAHLTRVDAGTKEINAGIVVFGSGGKRFARALFTATGGVAGAGLKLAVSSTLSAGAPMEVMKALTRLVLASLRG